LIAVVSDAVTALKHSDCRHVRPAMCLLPESLWLASTPWLSLAALSHGGRKSTIDNVPAEIQ
jgi:hypothetical protein